MLKLSIFLLGLAFFLFIFRNKLEGIDEIDKEKESKKTTLRASVEREQNMEGELNTIDMPSRKRVDYLLQKAFEEAPEGLSLQELIDNDPTLLEYLKNNYDTILPEITLGRDITNSSVLEAISILGEGREKEFYKDLQQKRPDMAVHRNIMTGLLGNLESNEDAVDFLSAVKNKEIYYEYTFEDMSSSKDFQSLYDSLKEKISESGNNINTFDALPVNFIQEWVKVDTQAASEMLANTGVRVVDYMSFVDSYIEQVSTGESIATFLEMQESGNYNPDFVAVGLERVHYYQPNATQEVIEALSPKQKEQAVGMIESVYESWGIVRPEEGVDIQTNMNLYPSGSQN